MSMLDFSVSQSFDAHRFDQLDGHEKNRLRKAFSKTAHERRRKEVVRWRLWAGDSPVAGVRLMTRHQAKGQNDRLVTAFLEALRRDETARLSEWRPIDPEEAAVRADGTWPKVARE